VRKNRPRGKARASRKDRKRLPQLRVTASSDRAGWRRVRAFLAQKRVQVAGEFVADAFDVANRGGAGGAEFFDRAEVFQQRGAAARAEAGKIVQHRLADFARTQVGVEGVGEAVSLVAQALQE